VVGMKLKGTRAARLARSSSEPVPINIFTPDHSCAQALIARLIMVSVPVNSLSPIQRPRGQRSHEGAGRESFSQPRSRSRKPRRSRPSGPIANTK
jgi:hypothetical protein